MKPLIMASAVVNSNVREAARALADAGWLEEFHVPIARYGDTGRRCVDARLRNLVRLHPWREAARLAGTRLGLDFLTAPEKGLFSIERVGRGVSAAAAGAVRRHPAPDGAVYAYEDGALELFRAARERGWKKIYDLPIGYWRAGQRLYAEEAGRRPEWAATLQGTGDSLEKLQRKDEELALADVVVTASRFTGETLREAPVSPGRLLRIPYGCPTPVPRRRPPSGRMRVLFVGALTQRKGISYLFEAVNALKGRVELTVIGPRPAAACAVLDAELARHNWLGALPRDRVMAEMEAHDVLVFPSLFEGFGLVIMEALSRGLPVITTGHTGGADILTDGVDGWIVPIRDAEAIQRHLEGLIDDPAKRSGMSAAALATAERWNWSRYRAALTDFLKPRKEFL